MPGVWRLYRSKYGPGLDGIGGTFAEGRWHARGTRIVYFGASAAIVVLERLAHTDADLLPTDLRLGYFEYPDAMSVTRVNGLDALPGNWVESESTTRQIGTSWIQEGTSCILFVPSAILPEESNVVFNPQHADAEAVRLVRERPFSFDPRLI
jgi:RES domain-containing protein